MIKREKYLSRIQPFIDKPVVKIITGIRRCGKSTFIKMLINSMIDKGISNDNIIYVNKDSLDFDFIQNYNDLHSYVTKRYLGTKGDRYLFVDEIQEIHQWERAVIGFLADDIADIYVTGSNAKMLSSELATLLSGRYVEFKMNTLSFSEFLQIRNKGSVEKESEFELYLKFGGFPGIHHIELSDEFIGQYINALYSTILLKDVVAKNQIRDVALLERIVRYVADNCGNITTAKGINNFIKAQHLKCSVDTIQNYLTWLADAHILYKANRFDIKGKRQLELYEKYFLGDTGFIFSILGNKAEDISGKLENIVYLELLSRGYKVSIGKLYDREIDFIAVKDNSKMYIQVAYLLTSEKVMEREFCVLSSVKDNYPKLVLSLDRYIGTDREGIQWQNLIDFLLNA